VSEEERVIKVLLRLDAVAEYAFLLKRGSKISNRNQRAYEPDDQCVLPLQDESLIITPKAAWRRDATLALGNGGC
jgi:hypothetical protein